MWKDNIWIWCFYRSLTGEQSVWQKRGKLTNHHWWQVNYNSMSLVHNINQRGSSMTRCLKYLQRCHNVEIVALYLYLVSARVRKWKGLIRPWPTIVSSIVVGWSYGDIGDTAWYWNIEWDVLITDEIDTLQLSSMKIESGEVRKKNNWPFMNLRLNSLKNEHGFAVNLIYFWLQKAVKMK